MSKEYNYDIFLNEEIIATVGPSTLKQLYISFGVTDEKPLVKAGGISEDEPGLLYINWLEENVNFNDSLRIAPSEKNIVTSPRHTKKLKRGMEADEEEDVCDFCNSSEEEVGPLIRLGASPLICKKCVKQCAEVFKT